MDPWVEGRSAQPMQHPRTEADEKGSFQVARQEARERGRRLAAEMSGALEGWLESLDAYGLQQTAADAAGIAGDIASAAVTEFRHQAREPGGPALQDDLRRGVGALSDGAETVWHKAQDGVQRAGQRISGTAREGAARVEHAAQTLTDEANVRAQALGRAGRRSLHSPRAIMHDARAATRARVSGAFAGAGLYVLAGMVGVAAFIVLTIALVVGLSGLVGAPEGAFLVALLYAVGAAAAILGARAMLARARTKARGHMDDARRELNNVTRPLARAFSRRRVAPPRTMDTSAGRASAIPEVTAEDVPQVPPRRNFQANEWNRR